MTTPELLPCAHCGGKAQHYHRPDTIGWTNTDWVSCLSDDCGVSTALEDTKVAAITVWNRRAGQAHADAGLLEALERIADPYTDRDGIECADIARAAIAAAKGATDERD